MFPMIIGIVKSAMFFHGFPAVISTGANNFFSEAILFIPLFF